jgi:hypothetical protein
MCMCAERYILTVFIWDMLPTLSFIFNKCSCCFFIFKVNFQCMNLLKEGLTTNVTLDFNYLFLSKKNGRRSLYIKIVNQLFSSLSINNRKVICSISIILINKEERRYSQLSFDVLSIHIE